ncbi:hypothetical protein G7Y89_g3486 [Cudoniella acicularis]|uniref:Catalase immune-responsive domain-containing protein n=1 Tax=Cudoniella acicularis TaxID=354080 RepID=A0A8H4W5X8_9HELO|nr:hypothetical protein G7Y89_g3486 [Cudoniella acicularis]
MLLVHFGRRSLTQRPRSVSSKNISGHMANCKKEEIIKRQIAIFREVSEYLASRLEKATGIKGYNGIADMGFNGTHNGMTQDRIKRAANGMKGGVLSTPSYNGAPIKGTHAEWNTANGVNGHSNGVSAH